MQRRRRFSREFKFEAVKLIRERGVSAAQAARDLDVHENVLRKWVKEFGSDPVQAFPGHGQMKPEQQEIERLRREVSKLKAEPRAPDPGATKCLAGGSRRALWPAIGRMAPVACGTTCWQRALPVVCTGSSG